MMKIKRCYWFKRVQFVLATIAGLAGSSFATDYYVSTQAEFDAVKNAVLEPGDAILLERGQQFVGMLAPTGTGTVDAPIRIGAYGEGERPQIHGMGVNEACISLSGVLSYWELAGLELTNTDGSELDQGDLYGIVVHVTVADTVHRHLYIHDFYIHDVNGAVAGKDRGGIHVMNDGAGSIFDDLRITANVIEDVGGVGIATRSSAGNVDLLDNGGLYMENLWTRVYVASNRLDRIGRNGIIFRDCEYGLIEYNIVGNTSLYDKGHNIFCFDSLGTTIQYNEAYGNVAVGTEGDRGGVDADFNCVDTLIQYNYSHDNEWFCGIMKKPNRNVVIRYNVSRNDRQGFYFFGFDNKTQCESLHIYNNTHYAPAGFTNAVVVLGRTPLNTIFENNIFYFEDGAVSSFGSDGINTFWTNNLYYNISAHVDDPSPVAGDPLFAFPGVVETNIDLTTMDALRGYQLLAGSPAIDAATSIPNNGWKDIVGNKIEIGSADVGAFESSSAGSSVTFTFLDGSPWDGGVVGANETLTNSVTGERVTLTTIDVIGQDGSRTSEGASHNLNVVAAANYLGINDASGNPGGYGSEYRFFNPNEGWVFSFDVDVYLEQIQLASQTSDAELTLSSSLFNDIVLEDGQPDDLHSLGSRFVPAGTELTLLMTTATNGVDTGVGVKSLMVSASTAGGKDSDHLEYDVYLVSGQSNCDGRGALSELTGELADWALPQSDVQMYYANPINEDPVNPNYQMGWTNLMVGLSVPPNYSPDPLPSSVFGPALSFGGTMAELYPERNIALIKVSQGGTNLRSDWNVTGNGYMWQTFTNQVPKALQQLVDAGHTYNVRGMIWHQGESDSNNSDYATDLEELIAAVRSLVGVPSLRFVLGELERDGDGTARAARNSDINSVALADPFVEVASSINLKTQDGTHFNAASQIEFGKRFSGRMTGYRDYYATAYGNGTMVREAEDFSTQTGVVVEATIDLGGGDQVGLIENGDGSVYPDVYFGNNPSSSIPFYFRVSCQNDGGDIELRLDSTTNNVIGTVVVTSTGSWGNYLTVTGSVSGVSGTHDLYLTYSGGSGYLMNVNWFEWTPADDAVDPRDVAAMSQEAEAYLMQSGVVVESCSDIGGGDEIGLIENGDWSSYTNIYFGSSSDSSIPFYARVSCNTAGGDIEVRLDGETGEVVGTLAVVNTGGWDSYVTVTGSVSGVSGAHDLYLTYSGGSGYLMNLNWFAWSPAYVLPDAVAKWTFDTATLENSGTSGSMHDGTFMNSTGDELYSTDTISGKGYALKLDSIADGYSNTPGGEFLKINNSASGDAGYVATFDTDVFTISMWIKTDGAWSQWDEFGGKGNGDDGHGWGLRARLFGTHALDGTRFDSYSNVTARDEAPYAVDLEDQQWHLMTATCDGSTIHLYLDAMLVATATGATITNTSPYALVFGARDDGSRGEDLLIDEIRFYDSALSVEEIEVLLSGEDEDYLPAFIPNLSITNGNFNLEFTGTRGEHYRIEYTEDLSSSNGWQVVSEMESLESSSGDVTVPATNNTGFYRVIWVSEE